MSTLYWPYLAADYYRGLEIVTAVVGIIILLSSLDDLFIDGWFWVRALRRRLVETGAMPGSRRAAARQEEQPWPSWCRLGWSTT